ncbi:hypothetical protein Nepgr_017492 [Nepenthes gracilis]|uniref:Glutaredoxin domain-containing protein n=1 Tax=Nepenthes gracilis TaxID=150966 RepID=A0AAD3SSQ3_NEPGR|nr:hypothetical protein Nepgr_017492 [Nepenthes gracilis]
MGCGSSRQSHGCRHCRQTPYSSVPRSYSTHVHHPPAMTGDSYHVVALTSSTLGSFKLDQLLRNQNRGDDLVVEIPPLLDPNGDQIEIKDDRENEFEIGMIEAKAWSKMIEEKIIKAVPKTPTMTPPGEPETINAWELMEGLEDASPPRAATEHFRSFSFHVNSDSIPAFVDSPKTRAHGNGFSSPRAIALEKDCLPKRNSIPKTIDSDFDPEIISAFRKALEELSPTHPFRLRPFDHHQEQPETVEEKKTNCSMEFEVTEEKKTNGFAEEENKLNGIMADVTGYAFDGKKRCVLYFTSLRGVRKTYEDCCDVRIILKGLGIKVDERDVSMHSGFKEELRGLLGDGFNRGGLPRVFVGEKYIGGAEDIRGMHEEGRLEKVLEGCQRVEDDGGSRLHSGVCEACGDIRFVPCETCSGSCKIYYEGCYDSYDHHHHHNDECEEGEYGFQRCPDCNENGLIRCPICCC